MALSLVDGIGDALVDVFLRAVDESRPRLRAMAAWLADVAQPPRGVRLVTDDGAEYTGIIVVEGNRPVVMLALRVGAASHREPRQAPAYAAPYATPYERPLWSAYDDDGPIR